MVDYAKSVGLVSAIEMSKPRVAVVNCQFRTHGAHKKDETKEFSSSMNISQLAMALQICYFHRKKSVGIRWWNDLGDTVHRISRETEMIGTSTVPYTIVYFHFYVGLLQ